MIDRDTLRTAFFRNPGLRDVLEFLFPNAVESVSYQGLRIEPSIARHRNLICADPFLLPRERFGGTQDLALVPLVRFAVDETLRAFATTSPGLHHYVGKTPISPYGSLGLSVSRWGQVDWDYVRDLDWRIFLPPVIGHTSGFKSELGRILTKELHKYELNTILGGKDEQGLLQVQLRDKHTDAAHGFHFYLIAMKPGFVKGNIHLDGGYSPHYAFFPESSMDAYLEAGNLDWNGMIAQEREDYIAMFNQLSFNIFGEGSDEYRIFKTKGWYLHKAFKWYARLARLRGLERMEEDLLYQYEHFEGSEAELAYLARYRYYARMAPSPQHLEDVDKDLARSASIVYARARNPDDPLVGQKINVGGIEVILLEKVARQYTAAAGRVLGRAPSSLLERVPMRGRIRFADNLGAPRGVKIDDHGEVVLIPAEWSMVFCDEYVQKVVKRAAEEGRAKEEEIREGLGVVMGGLLKAAG